MAISHNNMTASFQGLCLIFNRANGGLGSNWTGDKSGYSISAQKLKAGSGGYIYWGNTSFGANQEAYVTLNQITTSADEIDLLLKSQANTGCCGGVIEVWYQPTNQRIQVVTYTAQQDWVQRGADIPVQFVNGDRMGAVAAADGQVKVYRNDQLLATVDVTAWPYYASGGYVGLYTAGASNALFDDFGGGTIATQSSTSTWTPTLTRSATVMPTVTMTATRTVAPMETATFTPTFTTTATATATATNSGGYPAPPASTFVPNSDGSNKIYLPNVSLGRFGPLPAPGYYVTDLVVMPDGTDRFYNMGCEKGADDLREPGAQFSVVYLDFINAAYDPNPDPNLNQGYGAILYWGHFYPMANLEESSFQFARGYYECSEGDDDSRLVMALSINNGFEATSFTSGHGIAWGNIIRSLYDRLQNTETCAPNNGCAIGGKVTPAAGGDFEVGWRTFDETFSWISGYMIGVKDSESGEWRGDLYNFGDASGCPPFLQESYNNNEGCYAENGWYQDNVILISNKLPGIHSNVLPEIYYPNYGLSEQWANLSHRAAMPSSYKGRMSIAGVTSSEMACWQNKDLPSKCPEYYSADEAYSALYDVLAQDDITLETRSELRYITDMCFLGYQMENFCKH